MDDLKTLKKDVDYWHAEWKKERQRVEFLEQKIEFFENLPFGNGETLLNWAYRWDIAEALEKAEIFGLCERWEIGETVADLYEQAGFFLENGAEIVDPCALVYWSAFDKLAARFPQVESFLSVDASGCYSDFLADFKKTAEQAEFLKNVKEWTKTADTNEKESLKGILKEVLKSLEAPNDFFKSLFEVVETKTA